MDDPNINGIKHSYIYLFKNLSCQFVKHFPKLLYILYSSNQSVPTFLCKKLTNNGSSLNIPNIFALLDFGNKATRPNIHIRNSKNKKNKKNGNPAPKPTHQGREHPHKKLKRNPAPKLTDQGREGVDLLCGNRRSCLTCTPP